MIVAYLAPFYPHVSHTFIRREIEALERAGFEIARYSLRPPAGLVDPADRAEAAKTTVLLSAGMLKLGLELLRAAVMRPVRFIRAARLAVRCGRRSDRGVMRHLIYLAEACLLLRLLAERRAEHVHAHFGTNATTIAMLTGVLGGPPFSFTVHGPEEFDDPKGLALDVKIERSAFVIAISSFGRSQLFRWCAAKDWPKIHVVHCGLDASFLREARRDVPDQPRLVCVGRLCEQKGQVLLIEAVAELQRAGVTCELVLAGDGPMRPDVEAAIARHGLQKQTQITGWISGVEVRKLIASARALVLPSFAEGLPVVLMEALALGRPVVTTYVAGIPELVRHGIEGWLVPAGSVADLVNTLRCCLQTPTSRLKEMGDAGISRVAARHDVEREAQKLARYFHELPKPRKVN